VWSGAYFLVIRFWGFFRHSEFVYSSFLCPDGLHGFRVGQRIESGSSNFDDLAEWVKQNPEPVIASGRQELMENILNELL
jgi:hypothetical protein